MSAAAVIDILPETTRLFLFRQPLAGRELLITYLDGVDGPAVQGAQLVLSAEPPRFRGGEVYASAAPILPGKTSEWLLFARTMAGPEREELIEQRRRLGLKQTLFLMRDSLGDWVISVTEGKRPWEEAQRIAASQVPFDRWINQRLGALHGIDFSKPLPRNELLFKWDASAAIC